MSEKAPTYAQHHSDFVRACFIAKRAARCEADAAYWDGVLKTLDRIRTDKEEEHRCT